MKMKQIKYIWSGVLLLLLFTACDLLDPTDVTNPQTTDESLQQQGTGAATPFLNGVLFRFSDAVEDVIIFTEVVSDNYDNVSTFTSPLLDDPYSIFPTDLTLNHRTSGLYFEIQELRALANVALSTVLPNDPSSTDEQEAEIYFYRGAANMLSAENFSGAPIEENGGLVFSADLLQLAIEDFETALSISQHSDFAPRIHLALARAYRLAGDKSAAVSEADQAISAGGDDFVFYAFYDAENNVNNAYNFTVGRSNSDDYQPLPRLDFLDPKYLDRDSPIPFLKMEEAYLIKSEAALSDGAYGSAAQYLSDAVAIAGQRILEQFVDFDSRRDSEDGVARPDSGFVKADINAEARTGLIFPRDGNQVDVPIISGSSVDPDSALALNDPADLYHALYLARQEIFFYEGRRMSDLGIRLPLMDLEIETNNNINPGEPGTEVVVPSYIPQNFGMDAYSIDGDVTTIEVDMNRVLYDNRVSPFTLPF
jgi:tetratricopeptide (TPR) repeat protein